MRIASRRLQLSLDRIVDISTPRTITQSQKCNAILHHYIVYVWQTQIVDTTAHVVEDRLKTLIT